MVNYLMEITYSGGTFQFPITPKFFPTMRFNWKRSGHEVAVTDSVPVEGWFSENDQDVLLTKWSTLKAIASNGKPTVFVFKKETGAVIHQYNKAHIQDLASVDMGGGFVNHIQFTFNVQEERGLRFPGLVDVGHEDEETKEVDKDGVVKNGFRRMVTATGAFGNTAAARSFVEALKPSLTNLTRESIRTVNYDGTVTGIWEYDETNEENPSNSGLRLWKENASRMPGLRSGSFYRTSPGPAPVLVQGGFGPTKIRVSGHIEAYDLGSIPRPPEILNGITSQPEHATAIHFEDIEFGSYQPHEYDPDDPSRVTVFSHDYSFTIAFGEAGEPVMSVGPLVRSQRNGGGIVIGGPGGS
jgi:hypothetical protein